MSVFLVGGGFRDGSEEAVYGGFVSEAVARAASVNRSATEAEERPARIVVLTVREDAHPGHGNTLASVVQNVAGDRPVEVTTTVVAEGEPMPASALDRADGILVGGGLTPAYLSAFAPLAARIRREVETGVPYLGFSAGAMIAPDRALLGGWLIGGIEVVAQDAAEDLDELTIEDGLGLIDVTVDVHAVQWGNLSRAIAAVDSGAVDEVIGLVPRSAVHAGLRRARDMHDYGDATTVAAVLGCGRRTSAHDTVPFALWSAARALGDYETAFWTTAQVGGDVDTTCAIVGGVLAGARAGAPPAVWVAHTERLPDWVPAAF